MNIAEWFLLLVKGITTVMITDICSFYIRPVREGGSPVIGAGMWLIFIVSIWGMEVLRLIKGV